jgi:hypothetical protein
MNAAGVGALIDRNNVGELLAVAAPGIGVRFRAAIAAALINPHTTPDALFCLADALDEFAEHFCLTADWRQLFGPQITCVRTLATATRERAAQLAAP